MQHISKGIVDCSRSYCLEAAEAAAGFLRTNMTLSPRKNSLAINLSLLTGFAFFPFPFFGVSVQNSLAFSRTMFRWRSNALTRAKILRLLRQFIKTCELSFTLCVNTLSGPVRNSSSSFCFSSSKVSSLLGFALVHNTIVTKSFNTTLCSNSRHFLYRSRTSSQRLRHVARTLCACVLALHGGHYLESKLKHVE